MRDQDVKTLKEFLSYDMKNADEVLARFATLKGAEAYKGKLPKERFVFKPGTREDAITLVAHADTVFGEFSFIGGVNPGYYDQYGLGDYFRQRGNQKQTITLQNIDGQEIIFGTNPNTGIGADDRAGCAIAWLLANSGHNILVLDGEEVGAVGAKFLMREHQQIRDAISKSRFVLEFDRQGGNDYKCYQIPVSDDFKGYIEAKTGFKDAGMTSFTDISVLCEKVCGANLSVGYYNEHTPNEFLNVNEWLNTLNLTRQLTSERIPQFNLDAGKAEKFRQMRIADEARMSEYMKQFRGGGKFFDKGIDPFSQ